jgi:pyruvate-ferredoxin/flavodoxin oxidoreductase
MAHRTAYILQSSVANPTHLIEGFIDGLNAKRPALFNVYSACMPEHGIGDDLAEHQAKLAVESRAYPLIKYNPDKGELAEENFDIEGNPAVEQDWPTYTLEYTDEKGAKARMELPMTFADFAVTEARFRKQFKTAPRDTWNENMIPLAEYLDLSADDREGKYPYIWAVDKKNRLTRVIPAEPIVKATEDRRRFWRMVKSLAGVRETVDVGKIAEQAKAEFAQTIAAQLLHIANNGNILTDTLPGVALAPSPIPTTVSEPLGSGPLGSGNGASNDGYVAPWIDSSQCSACDECMNINSKIFAYDEQKHAYVKDAKGGPYKDLVRAAEKCTAQVIHPGTPFDPKEKDIDKLLKRAAKYN